MSQAKLTALRMLHEVNVGDGITIGIRTHESLGHLAYYMAKRLPGISDQIRFKFLEHEFPKRRTIQNFAVYRGDSRHSPHQLGIKSARESAVVLKRVNAKSRILRSIFGEISKAARQQFDAEFGDLAKRHRTFGESKTAKKPRQANSPSLSTDAASLEALEGLKTETRSIRSNRSQRLRKAALNAASGICCVCDRDFSKMLNGRGVRVLQVHHRDQLSARAVPAITTQSDLAVVCANCHLLLHLDAEKALSVAELRKMLREDGNL